MGLSPKPSLQEPTQTWEDLDRFLKSMFSQGTKSKDPVVAYIDPDKYVMTTDEILQSAKENNYKTSIGIDGMIKFE
ncbi:hypothetical protein [Leuconostoc gasicomitatum]|uniref:hypothetical protein n=1 Tax=Leuconostoc gasicomitatum TaxID=115778 RepID=UPI001CC6F864|nr:hypothetical protein [Leuconostoc gasicomitatum]MBZ5969006.1 hypothetical protein [Leuconostoc gasicomitatum]MBZ5980071.1 hypothetical protein [Leuconostoc gasicomitatum]